MKFARICAALTALLFGAGLLNAQSIEITVPDTGQHVREGRDYATWELGNRWEMSCPDWSGLSGDPGDPIWDGRFTCDLVVSRNRCVTNELFDAGSYFATSTSTCNSSASPDPNLILVSPGPVAGVGLSNGRLYPIDTTVYRHFTVKIRTLNTTQNQGSMVFFQTSGDANDPFGRTNFGRIEPGGWRIISFDLVEDVAAGSQLTWTGQNQVIGLRYDPVPNDGIDFEIDWARLSADPNLGESPDTTVPVEWTSSGLPAGTQVTISAVDEDGAQLELANGIDVAAGEATVNLSRLAPGLYSIRLEAGGVSDLSHGQYRINAAPEFHFTQPDRRGDETRDYATDVLGNAWGPMDAADLILDNNAQTNLENIAFLGGDLVADAPDGGQSPGDPRITFATPVPIDTGLYRMFSYEYQLEILPDQIGSVTRIHWGTDLGVDPTPDTVSDDIRVRRGFNTYVLGDMTEVPDRDGLSGQWNGDLTVLRFDPHEVDATREISFRNLRLRPLDTANPDFEIQWIVTDEDVQDDLRVSLYLDPDVIPWNDNESLIGEDLPAEVGSFVWDSSGTPPGEYRVLALVFDGLNLPNRYSSASLQVNFNLPQVLFKDGFE